MKRRNDLYITEYMLQASLQNRQKGPRVWKYIAVPLLLVLIIAAVYVISTRSL